MDLGQPQPAILGRNAPLRSILSIIGDRETTTTPRTGYGEKTATAIEHSRMPCPK